MPHSLTKLKIAVSWRGLLVTHGGVFQSWGYWWLFPLLPSTSQSLIFLTFPQIPFITSRLSLGTTSFWSCFSFALSNPLQIQHLFSLSSSRQACGPQLLASNLEVPTSVGKGRKEFSSVHLRLPGGSPVNETDKTAKQPSFLTCAITHVPGNTQWWVAHLGG